MKLAVFYQLFFSEVSPEKFCEIPAKRANFFNFFFSVSENPAKFDFFLRNLSEALYSEAFNQGAYKKQLTEVALTKCKYQRRCLSDN